MPGPDLLPLGRTGSVNRVPHRRNTMSADAHKNLNEAWIQAFNSRDWAAEAACRAPEYTVHLSGAPRPLDNTAWAAFMDAFIAAFPDAWIIVNGAVSEGDLVASRWTLTGTHRGEFQGVPATGRPISMEGVDFSRVEDGKIVEHWAQFDVVGVIQQITE